MKRSIAIAFLAAGLCGIGGTGHATPRVALSAYVVDRDAALGVLSKDWRGPRLAAFARLLAAEQTFARTLATNETGTAPGSKEASDAEQAEKDVFVATMKRLVAGKLARGESSAADTDEALNEAYGQVMKVDDPSELGWGGVDKGGILRTERAWIAYRDAFAAFAATLDAPDAAETITWELTRQRTASLDAFLGD